MSFPIIKFVGIAALRDKILITFLILVLMIGSLSGFFGSATVTEQMDFALVYKAGSLRLAGVISLILFICFYMRRAFETKEVEYLLTRPVSRLQYILSHAASFALIGLFLAVLIAGVILVTGSPNIGGWALWTYSLAIEYVLMALIAMFFSLVVTSPAGSALICIAFYALARMIGTILGISNLPTDSLITEGLGYIMEVISIIVPRFDIMGQTSWLVYGKESASGFEIDRFAESAGYIKSIGLSWFLYLQALGFSVLLITASAYDFSRKQF